MLIHFVAIASYMNQICWANQKKRTKKTLKHLSLSNFKVIVGKAGQLSNSVNQASPDEAHQNKKPTVAKAMVGEVGTTRFELATLPTPVGMRYRAATLSYF